MNPRSHVGQTCLFFRGEVGVDGEELAGRGGGETVGMEAEEDEREGDVDIEAALALS